MKKSRPKYIISVMVKRNIVNHEKDKNRAKLKEEMQKKKVERKNRVDFLLEKEN